MARTKRIAVILVAGFLAAHRWPNGEGQHVTMRCGRGEDHVEGGRIDRPSPRYRTIKRDGLGGDSCFDVSASEFEHSRLYYVSVGLIDSGIPYSWVWPAALVANSGNRGTNRTSR
ncbi:hypothetical protein EV126DRAFT_427373 [Verticillium dahliae]|nr:hypothetical protein EV126DRAFT_427373 [Verticillium dahliae]